MPKLCKSLPIFLLLVLMLFGTIVPKTTAGEKVGALGHILPGSGVVHLVAPIMGRIGTLHVKEGDRVEKGALLAVLEDNKLLQGELSLAKLALEEAKTIGALTIALQELKVREVSEMGQIATALQELSIRATQEDYDFALESFKRFKALGGDTLSEAQMATRKHVLAAADLKLDTAQKILGRLQQEQTIKLAQAKQVLAQQKKSWQLKVQRTENNLKLLKQKLDLSTLKAPIKGTILEVFQHVGETTGSRPILKMADLRNMYVIAEVFQGDLLKLSPGLMAKITSNALPQPLTGKVETIGNLISTQSRTAKVRIRLENSQLASKLIGLEVDISIEL